MSNVAQKSRVEYTQEGNNENVICEKKINKWTAIFTMS